MTQAAKPEAGTAALTAEDLAKAATDARTAERARMSAITGCDEAKDKPKLASHIAMSTDMSVEDAKKMLAAAAPEVTSAAATTEGKTDATDGFKATMDAAGGTGVVANTTAGKTEMTAAERILATREQVYGKRQ